VGASPEPAAIGKRLARPALQCPVDDLGDAYSWAFLPLAMSGDGLAWLTKMDRMRWTARTLLNKLLLRLYQQGCSVFSRRRIVSSRSVSFPSCSSQQYVSLLGRPSSLRT
jgi:hypothetical protein